MGKIMKQQINETKRMQQLAGILKENLNILREDIEDDIDDFIFVVFMCINIIKFHLDCLIQYRLSLNRVLCRALYPLPIYVVVVLKYH